MRITNSNSASSYMHALQSNLQRIDKVNRELTTQSVINKVSDDPYKAIKVIDLKNEIANTEKLNANADELLGWTEHTDSVLDSIGSITSEIKTLLTSINDIQSETEVNSVKKEIIEKTKQIAELFNSSYAGQNIFSGSNTDEKAVEIVTNPNGTITISKTTGVNNENLKGEISPGITIVYNTTVDEVTKNGEMFDTLNEVISTLNTMPIDMAKVGELQGKLDSAITGVLDARSTAGAKMNSISNMKSNNTTSIEKMTETLSLIRDTDMSAKAIELKSAELAYMASLQVGTKLMQNTILDHIR